jgi:RNA polymerase sigma factor (sigma-70 family)
MPQVPIGKLFALLRQARPAAPDEELSDGALLERFLGRRDEAAFASLLERHGPMVLGVCRRVLGDSHDAEDAFQATFLVLARKAASIQKQTSVGSWLYGVAQRISCKARSQAAARRERERRVVSMPGREPIDELTWQELRGILDEEVGRLPEKYRAPVVLCHLEGKSYEQAARDLGCPKSTLARRLGKAHELLRGQLAGRGLAMSAAALALVLTERATAAPVGASLGLNIVQAAARVAAGQAPEAGVLSKRAIKLAEEAMTGMTGIKGKLVLLLVVLGLIAGAALVGHAAWTKQEPPRTDPKGPAAAKQEPKKAPPTDRDGDRLPAGAVARLGSARFRHGKQTVALAYSPDGNWLASISRGNQKHTFHLLDARTGKVRHRLTFDTNFPYSCDVALAFSPDSKTLITPSAVIDLATGKVRPQKLSPIGDDYAPTAPIRWNQILGAYSPDGKLIVRHYRGSKGNGTALVLLDAATGKKHKPLFWSDKDAPLDGADGLNPEAAFPRPVFSPDSSILAAATVDKKVIELWDVRRREKKYVLKAHEQSVTCLAFSADGKLLASTSRKEGMIRLWDVQTGKPLPGIKIDAQMACTCVAIAPDGKVLASAANLDVILHRYDLPTRKTLDDSSRGHIADVYALRFTPGGETLVALDGNRTALEWDLTTKQSRDSTFGSPLGSMNRLQMSMSDTLSPNGKVAAVNGTLGEVPETINCLRLCDVVTGKVLHTLGGKHAINFYPEFSPDGKMVALGTGVEGVKLFDVVTGKPLPHPPLPRGFIFAWSGDGKRLAAVASSQDTVKQVRSIFLFDVQAGQVIHTFETKTSTFQTATGIALSPDGKSLASFNKVELAVFDTESKTKRILPPKAPVRVGVPKLSFSPSGQYLAVALTDTIELWDVRSEQRVREFHAGHQATALRFTANGQTLATGGDDGTILLWDLKSLR